MKPRGEPPIPVNPGIDFRAGKMRVVNETSGLVVANADKKKKPAAPTPEPEKPAEDVKTKPGVRPSSHPVTTTPEANANQSSNPNT